MARITRILFIIVFISCSLYSIIFTIFCSLLVLSPLHICFAYIFNTCHSAVYTNTWITCTLAFMEL